MEAKQFIEQLAESAEEFLITWKNYNAELLEDLKILVQLFPTDLYRAMQSCLYKPYVRTQNQLNSDLSL